MTTTTTTTITIITPTGIFQFNKNERIFKTIFQRALRLAAEGGPVPPDEGGSA